MARIHCAVLTATDNWEGSVSRDLTNLPLLHEFKRVVERLINRHFSMLKEWSPHDYAPWSDGMRAQCTVVTGSPLSIAGAFYVAHSRHEAAEDNPRPQPLRPRGSTGAGPHVLLHACQCERVGVGPAVRSAAVGIEGGVQDAALCCGIPCIDVAGGNYGPVVDFATTQAVGIVHC